MFKNNLKKLINIFETSNLNSIEISSFWGLRKVKLGKDNTKSESPKDKSITHSSPEVKPDNEIQADKPMEGAASQQTYDNIEVSEETIKILSPLVGTFYISPKPGSPPFITVGDTVEEGQTLCIVEAMKIFNEIESDYNGKIIQILVEDGSPIEYDQPLMILKK